jgi:hypothetical protein
MKDNSELGEFDKLNEFYKSLIDLSENFYLEGYIRLINEFKDFLGLNTSMQLADVKNFSEDFDIGIILITDFLLNLKQIFCSVTNRTFEVTYDFIICLLEGKYYKDAGYVLSLVNRLASKQKYSDIKYVKRLQNILKEFGTSKLKASILNRLNNHNNEKKDLIKLFKNFDNELSLCQYNNTNTSFNNETSLSLVECFDDFKANINRQITNKTIAQYFYMNFIQNVYDKASLTFPLDTNEECLRYLYIIKKTVDNIDNLSKRNKYLEKLFLNILMRSKTFLRSLLNQVEVNYNYVYFTNKEIYIETYGVLGYYLDQLIYYDRSLVERYVTKGVKIVSEIKKYLTGQLSDLVSNGTISEFELLESALNETHASYTSCFPTQSMQENWLGLSINLKTSNSLREVIGTITGYLMKVKIVKTVAADQNIIYLKLTVDATKYHIQHYYMVITVNSEIIFRTNALYDFIKDNELFVNLYIVIKYWALQRGLLYTPEHFINNNPKDCFIDNTMLLYFMIYYLIRARALEQVKPDGFKGEFRILKCDRHNYYTEKYKTFSYPTLHHSRKFKGFGSQDLAKLFINFFHFNVGLTRTIIHSYSQEVYLDLNCTEIVTCKSDKSRIIFKDLLCKSVQEEKLITTHIDKLKKDEKDISTTDWDSRKMIMDINYRNITVLENESYRVLHYSLNDEGNSSNIRFAHLFIRKN